jgi:hypothetical protein
MADARDGMTRPPLYRRREALAVDEGSAPAWTESERLAVADSIRRAEAQRDRAQVALGQRLLAGYMAPGVTYRDVFRAYMGDLLAPGGWVKPLEHRPASYPTPSPVDPAPGLGL